MERTDLRGLRSRERASWQRILDAATHQGTPQLAKHGAEASIDVKDRRQRERPRDFADWAFVDESEREQQTIRGRQLLERRADCVIQFRPPEPFVRVVLGRVRDLIGVELGGDALDEVAAPRVLGATGRVHAARTTVSPPVVIQSETTRYDEQPGLEAGIAAGGVGAQPIAVVRSQCLQHVSVCVHRAVVIVHDRSACAEDDVAVLGDEGGPGILALRAFARQAKPSEGLGRCQRGMQRVARWSAR